jgi:hypothetical protein
MGGSGEFHKFIRLESRVVTFKLAIIAGFLAALGWYELDDGHLNQRSDHCAQRLSSLCLRMCKTEAC